MNDFKNDADLFGEDLIVASQRWARPVVDGAVNQLRGELGQLKVETARNRCMAALDADAELGGRWRTINDSPDFLNWLAAKDPMSGEQRMALIRRAYDLGASDRVAAMFRAFLAEQLPARQRTNQRLPFEPGALGASTPTDANGRRMWRRADIAKFFADRRAGKYDQREAEGLRIEADIVAAPRDGRIIDPPARHGKDA